jgi:hypothetical protein
MLTACPVGIVNAPGRPLYAVILLALCLKKLFRVALEVL